MNPRSRARLFVSGMRNFLFEVRKMKLPGSSLQINEGRIRASSRRLWVAQ